MNTYAHLVREFLYECALWVFTHIHMYICKHGYIGGVIVSYICMYTHVHINMYTHTCTYTQVYTYECSEYCEAQERHKMCALPEFVCNIHTVACINRLQCILLLIISIGHMQVYCLNYTTGSTAHPLCVLECVERFCVV